MSTQAQRLRETADILPHDVYSWLHPIMTEAAAEIERLRAALRPFAEVARGDRLNPTPDEWQRASVVYTNTSANEQKSDTKP